MRRRRRGLASRARARDRWQWQKGTRLTRRLLSRGRNSGSGKVPTVGGPPASSHSWDRSSRPPPQASLPCRGAPEVQRFKEAASHPKAQSCNDCFSERDVQHVEGMECPPGLSYNPVQRFPPRRMEPDCEEEHGDMPEDHRACHAVLPRARLSLDRFRAADHLVHLEEDRLSTIIIAAEAFRAFDLKIKGRGRLDLSPSPLFTFNNTD